MRLGVRGDAVSVSLRWRGDAARQWREKKRFVCTVALGEMELDEEREHMGLGRMEIKNIVIGQELKFSQGKCRGEA